MRQVHAAAQRGGLEELSTGDVLLGDRVVTHVDPGERDVAMVFQNYALYPHMSVAENIGFALKQRRMPPAEISGASRLRPRPWR